MTTTRISRHVVKITRNDDDDNYDEDYASPDTTEKKAMLGMTNVAFHTLEISRDLPRGGFCEIIAPRDCYCEPSVYNIARVHSLGPARRCRLCAKNAYIILRVG
ncbi:unnamed protein product, partial [Trichogramma brassicae]